MAVKEKSLMRQLIEERGVKDLAGVHSLVKELTAGMIQDIMDAELDSELGYSKYDYANKQTTNSRNGRYKKNVNSSSGEIEISVPRDRQGEYEPQIVKKHQMDISEIEDKIIYMYSEGLSTRDIERTMREMYDIEVDATRVSKITDKLIPVIREWQNRPLESVYAMVVLDAVHYKVREDGVVVKKAVYVAIGTDLEGRKDVLGLWVGATESSKYWLGVLNGLRNRGVADILIMSVDGLTGFSEAIAAAYPKTDIQRCVIHQIRSSTRYVNYKDIKAVMADLKPVYKAPTEEAGLAALDKMEGIWGMRYPALVNSWREHWDELATMFKYPEPIRRIIYTTNAIENFNRQLRKVTKTKGAFVSDDALLKQLYLVTMRVIDKWTMPIQNWGTILMTLSIYFEDRVKIAA
jgi:transposase-like protein